MAENPQLKDELLDEIEGLDSPKEAWDTEAIKAFQAGLLDASAESETKDRSGVSSLGDDFDLEALDDGQSPVDLDRESNPQVEERAAESLNEASSLDDIQAIERNLAENASKLQTAQQMQRMVDSKPLIDAIMAAQDAARVAEEAAETNLTSTKLIVERFNEQEDEARRRENQTMRYIREMDFRIQEQSGKSSWAARLAVVNLILLLGLLGAGGAAFWFVSQSPAMHANALVSGTPESAELQRSTLDAVLEINNSLRLLERNLEGLQTQWLVKGQSSDVQVTPVAQAVVPSLEIPADLAAIEQDIRFLKTNLVAIKQKLLGNTADREIVRLRESLELLKSELVGMKIQEQKVAAQIKAPEPGPYKYVVPPNLNPY